jgi:hypothetical protein
MPCGPSTLARTFGTARRRKIRRPVPCRSANRCSSRSSRTVSRSKSASLWVSTESRKGAVNFSPRHGDAQDASFPASVRSPETCRHLKGPTGDWKRRRGTKRRNHRGEGEELLVEADVVRNLLAGESKMIVPARPAETARGNRAGSEPERCRSVGVDLAGLYLRFAGRVGLSLHLARRLAATDDVTTVGGCL